MPEGHIEAAGPDLTKKERSVLRKGTLAAFEALDLPMMITLWPECLSY
jgi:hypothetical protein